MQRRFNQAVILFSCLQLIPATSMAVVDPFSHLSWIESVQQTKALYQNLKQAYDSYKLACRNYQEVVNTVKLADKHYKETKKSLQKLDMNSLLQLKSSIQFMHDTLNQVKSAEEALSKDDKQYNENFTNDYSITTRNSSFDNEQTKNRIDASLAAQKNALNSIRVLETHAKQQEHIGDAIESSNQAVGPLQATQSTNKLLAVMAENDRQTSYMIAKDIEQRSLALSQEQLDKDWANKVNKDFWKGGEKRKRNDKKNESKKLNEFTDYKNKSLRKGLAAVSKKSTQKLLLTV